MPKDGQVDYVEFAVSDPAATKAFYGAAFGWTFQDYGPDYIAFEDGRLTGGFNPNRPVLEGGPLVILYAADLDAMEKKVVGAGAVIVERHSFPGGRRFHFRDPNGNVLAVWSEK